MTPSKRAVAQFEEAFTKKYGEGTMTTPDINDAYEVISTGSLALDDAVGVGGIVRTDFRDAIALHRDREQRVRVRVGPRVRHA